VGARRASCFARARARGLEARASFVLACCARSLEARSRLPLFALAPPPRLPLFALAPPSRLELRFEGAALMEACSCARGVMKSRTSRASLPSDVMIVCSCASPT
jgi:hypothetical protein